jgi:hypothetical protein
MLSAAFVVLDCFRIEGVSLAFNDADCTFRAFAETGGKPVTVVFRYKPCLAVYELYRAFCAGGDTLSAPITTVLVYIHYLSLRLHDYLLVS